MRKLPALQRGSRGAAALTVKSIPAPIGGINARDSEAAMAPTDAISMENFWPDSTEVSLRKGASFHLTGMSGGVRTLLAYESPTASSLWAATGTGIYDATTEGAVGASVKTITSGRFSQVLMTVAGGTYIIAVNGADKLLQYNGATWDFIDGASAPAITGLATTSLSAVALFKRRLFFVEKNSMNAWYLPVSSIGGLLVKFPLGELFEKGGKLLTIGTWTIDGGSGQDDHLVFVTTEGEVAIYKGIDPASDLAQVGTYYVGRPLGVKCLVKYGGDLLIMTVAGLIQLSTLLQGVIPNRNSRISQKIDKKFASYAGVYETNTGWSASVFPTENMLLLNVPTATDQQARQVLMNTITNAWTEFSGWDALCWVVWKSGIYFGGTTFVARALVGESDFGAEITAVVKQAHNYLGSTQIKQVTLLRPILTVSGGVLLGLGIDSDFELGTAYGFSGADLITPGTWDVGLWDEATWAADPRAQKDWLTVFSTPGFSAALRLRVSTMSATVSWSSTDFGFKKGGIL